MELSYPIPTKPEFSMLESPGYREYRLEKRRRPSQRWQGIISFFFLFSLAVALYWQSLSSSSGYIFLVASSIVSCIVLGFFGQVLYESVVILGPHGIQLETHRGFLTRLPWLTNRRFIASTHLHGVYINEGLKGWNVRFYLVAIKHTALTGSTFEVAYQNLLPDQSILQHVYQGIHEILLSSTTTNR